jgi:hypothetical protein
LQIAKATVRQQKTAAAAAAAAAAADTIRQQQSAAAPNPRHRSTLPSGEYPVSEKGFQQTYNRMTD